MDEYLYDLRYKLDRVEWRARGRRELVLRMIRRYAPSSAPIRSLDVGCGTGLLVEELGALGPAAGVEPSERGVAFCQARGLSDVHQAMGASLPFGDASFDVVTSIDVIEHIEDDRAALAEIHRVCKPGGLIVIIVPAFMHLWSTRDERLHHFRRYRRGQLRTLCEQAGFETVRASYVDLFLYLPLLVMVKLARKAKGVADVKVDAVVPPAPVNALLLWWMRLEMAWLSVANLPIGVSAMVVARKR